MHNARLRPLKFYSCKIKGVLHLVLNSRVVGYHLSEVEEILNLTLTSITDVSGYNRKHTAKLVARLECNVLLIPMAGLPREDLCILARCLCIKILSVKYFAFEIFYLQ